MRFAFELRPRPYPAIQKPVLSTALRISKPAFVSVRVGWFRQNETLGRLIQVNSPITDLRMIRLKVITKQREPEATSPLKRTMTRAAITTKPSHQRHHVLLKTRRFLNSRRRKSLRNRRESLTARVVCHRDKYSQRKKELRAIHNCVTHMFVPDCKPTAIL